MTLSGTIRLEGQKILLNLNDSVPTQAMAMSCATPNYLNSIALSSLLRLFTDTLGAARHDCALLAEHGHELGLQDLAVAVGVDILDELLGLLVGERLAHRGQHLD